METLYNVFMDRAVYQRELTLCELSKVISIIKRSPKYRETDGIQYFHDWKITIETATGKGLEINI